MPMMKSLEDIKREVRGLTGDDVRFSLVNVRVMLRTGVNLKAIKETQNVDTRAVRQVVSALADLGYVLELNRRPSHG